ncbi:tRNA threonylcarbamoyladenosine dehydratase [Isachenkonia alkalipeptolytica]|uniref:tRNA threonylcarbamoyladenosine dehydratase n=1 Tax=Isachenkonia alkalipeptolytica TaxID=2565777 RepID=A0AA43XM70_9CLOT|nr:tRNA threonylcarbamoyladenosine dehydratase [Isachenkonia alkalipeptolytica]NBG88909.1 tRNA threonylcarbamoyladenosine dehydratase [Isachenkonia alkalipeptolytica]
MSSQFERTELLANENSLECFFSKHIAVFGVGGVGSYAAEALVRAGIKEITILDSDVVCVTNINRQIQATHKTVGQGKVTVMRDRLLDINPNLKVHSLSNHLSKDNIHQLVTQEFDYIIDAIDTISAKLLLIEEAKKLDIPVISSMGAGNKIDPTKFLVADIHETNTCPLARIMRKELRRRNLKDVKVVFSVEKPLEVERISTDPNYQRKKTPGSISFVPSAAGMVIASEVFKDLWKGA